MLSRKLEEVGRMNLEPKTRRELEEDVAISLVRDTISGGHYAYGTFTVPDSRGWRARHVALAGGLLLFIMCLIVLSKTS